MEHEQYLQAGMHIGMKQQTKQMKKFIYKTREDGLAVLDLQTIDQRIKLAANFLSNFKSIMVVSRKVVGQKPASKFAEAINGKAIVGRFLPGIITNPDFPGYFEPDVIIITDPLVDKQAMVEAVKMRIPVIALCDTFNETNLIDLIIPVNNKGRKSLAMLYYTLAKEILKSKNVIASDSDFKFKIEEFEAKEQEVREEKE
jgi:small subunit ribosomal protein S2